MRDGVRLYTVVYVPRDATPRRRYPVILQRTPFSVGPYGPGAYPRTLGPSGFALRDGYIFVSQEVRGRYLSEGAFENVRPLLDDSVRLRDPRATDEATDAYDTVEWLVRNLSGHDGRVGLLGVSYGGYYAAAAALSGHPAIVASSLQAPVVDFFFEDFHHNGALLQGHFYAYPVFGVPRPEPTASHWWLPEYLRVAAHGMADDYAYQLGLGPLRDVTSRIYPDNLWWREMAAHPDYDAFWQARSMAPRLSGVTHPSWWWGAGSTPRTCRGRWRRTARCARAARRGRFAGDGPFGHRGWAAREVTHTPHGDLYFGDSLATAFQRDVEAAFFRAHLKGARAAPAGALMFDTGRKAWARFDQWPAPEAARRDYFLRGDGALAATPPAGGPAFVEYASDPRSPVPARCWGRRSRRECCTAT